MAYTETKRFLNDYGRSVVNEQKTRLKSFGKGGGPLEASLRYRINKDGNGVLFFVEDYGLYVDKGVEGAETHKAGKGGKSVYKYKTKMPPTKALDKWVVKKGIAPRKEGGKFASRASIKFAIARAIFKRGITPTNFFTIPIARSEKRFKEGIEKSMKKDIENEINRRLK